MDWHALRALSTEEIIRSRRVPDDGGAGVLWDDAAGSVELSAYGALAWDGRETRPAGAAYEWSGLNLLCSAAPTPFVLDGERYSLIDSCYHALKIPEGTAERAACAMAPLADARRLARGFVADGFLYRGRPIVVGSAEHEGLLAAAISAKVDQHESVLAALRQTGAARLVFPLPFSEQPGLLARVTPLALMVERWRRLPPRP